MKFSFTLVRKNSNPWEAKSYNNRAELAKALRTICHSNEQFDRIWRDIIKMKPNDVCDFGFIAVEYLYY